jgi:hypothetical protein
MSIAVLRGLPAPVLRHAILPTAALRPILSTRHPSKLITRPLSNSTNTGTGPSSKSNPNPSSSPSPVTPKPEDQAAWNRAVSVKNSKKDPLGVVYDPKPTSRGGLIQPACYSPYQEFIKIDLSPLPHDDDMAERIGSVDSTRPAPLNAPTRQPGQSLVKHLWGLGRAYYQFYKIGVRNIWLNRRTYRELKDWIRPFTIVASARYGGEEWKIRRISVAATTTELVPIPHLYRREFITWFRYQHDRIRALPFGLLLLVFGEFTPLVVFAIGNSIVPYTCRIPFQQRQLIQSQLKRFKTWKTQMRKLTLVSCPNPKHPFDYSTSRLEHHFRRDLLIAYLVGQSPFARPLLPLASSFYFHVWLEKRLSSYWENIFCDNILIRREGGFAALTPQDVYEYALNYGSLTLLTYMEREVTDKKNYDFVNEDLKNMLVPILEAEAEIMFNDDFTRLRPELHWLRAYRDTARWADSPDVVAAVELKEKYDEERRAEGKKVEDWRPVSAQGDRGVVSKDKPVETPV